MTQAGAHLDGCVSLLAPAVSAASAFSVYYNGEIAKGNTGAVAVSMAFGAGDHAMRIGGTFLVSIGGVIQLQAAAAAGVAPVQCLPGSWMRVFKLS